MANDSSSSFTIKVVGESTGTNWSGVFKTKLRLSHKDQLRRDQLRRELLGDKAEQASGRAQNQAEIFSEIAVHLIDSPQWWKVSDGGLDLEDDVVVKTVYDEILKAKADAAKKLSDAGEAAKAELQKIEPAAQ